VLHERVKTYKNWKDAEATLTKKREIKAKLELAHKTDKISAANQEITDVSWIFYTVLYIVLTKFKWYLQEIIEHFNSPCIIKVLFIRLIVFLK